MRLKLPETGAWGDKATWEFQLTREITPEQRQLTSAIACVAITNFSRQEMIVTRSKRGLGMVAETIEPGETVEEAIKRGLLEEGGCLLGTADRVSLFGMKKVVNNPNVAQKINYPPVGYMPYYYATISRPRVPHTGKEIIECGPRPFDDIVELVKNGLLDEGEGAIMEAGFLTAQEDRVRGRF